ncbi:MAG: iduronate-2-sulfatase [Planctomycetaceae bacterium]|nr:iduronate-2-sulfatase [Planctomycetaceae bacterium]|tara:strand:- start:179 stop:1648 length:1470 start_codon:yes stop_codon:yes gene_type:complete
MNKYGLNIACFCLALLLLTTPARGIENPNILFLICDDLNCDIGSYGHPQVKTPHIDRLASRGVLFSNAHCQYPLCGPSRASFMSGLYPDQTLVRRNAIYIRERIPNVLTIPQAFRLDGYFAVRIGKVFHYNVPRHIGTSGHDDPYSWNYTINPRGRDKDEEDKIFSLDPNNFGGTLSWLAADGTDNEQTDGIAATEAVALLKRYSHTNQRFFMTVGLYRPHTPYVAPRKYFEMYPLDTVRVPDVPDGYLQQLPNPAIMSIRRKENQIELDTEIARQVIQAYYASISFADAQLGRVLSALKTTGLDKTTIVVFTSDHGYHMGEHGHWQKTTLFENSTRVPLVIAGPGVLQKGVTADGLAELVDIYPTMSDMAGQPKPKHLSGVSLRPMLEDASNAVRSSALTQYSNGYSIRTNRYRYTQWGPDGGLGAELYDHESDPAELVNIYGRPGMEDVQMEMQVRLNSRINYAKQKPLGIKQILEITDRRVPQPNP